MKIMKKHENVLKSMKIMKKHENNEKA